MFHYTTLLYWIAGVMDAYTSLPFVFCWVILLLLVAYLSLYPSLFAVLMAHLRARSRFYFWSAPFLWAGLEYVRGFLLSGFPWENLGYSQYRWLHLIQISDIIGIYGLSALIMAVNVAFFEIVQAIRRKRGFSWKPAMSVAFIVVCVLAYGTWRMAEIDQLAQTSPKMAVALVQGNIDQSRKWVSSFQSETIRRYSRLTRMAMKSGPDLIVWPETALPFYFLYQEPLTREVLNLVRACRVYFLLGSPSFRKDRGNIEYYNSAYLLDPSGKVLGKYDKVHLVPYGEYIPLKRFFPFLGKVVESAGDFKPGTEGQFLSLNKERIGVLICFEAIFPELSRAMAQNGAQLLVNITNDAWFGRSSAPYQHLSMAVFRAVENRRAVARAANTGISAFIDPAGRIIDETALFKEAVRTRSLPMMAEKTFYCSHGDLFAKASILITLIVCITLALSKNTQKERIGHPIVDRFTV